MAPKKNPLEEFKKQLAKQKKQKEKELAEIKPTKSQIKTKPKKAVNIEKAKTEDKNIREFLNKLLEKISVDYISEGEPISEEQLQELRTFLSSKKSGYYSRLVLPKVFNNLSTDLLIDFITRYLSQEEKNIYNFWEEYKKNPKIAEILEGMMVEGTEVTELKPYLPPIIFDKITEKKTVKYVEPDSPLEEKYLTVPENRQKREEIYNKILKDQVTPESEIVAMYEISKALTRIAPNVLDYGKLVVKETYTDIKFDTEYNKELIKAFADKSKNNIEFFTHLGRIVIILSKFNSKIFQERLRREYYTPQVLAGLPLSELYPEVLSDPRVDNNHKDQVVSRIDRFIERFNLQMAQLVYIARNPTKKIVFYPEITEQVRTKSAYDFFYEENMEKLGDINRKELGRMFNLLSEDEQQRYLNMAKNLKEFTKKSLMVNDWKTPCENFEIIKDYPDHELVYYEEDGKTYCFPIADLQLLFFEDEPKNPHTENPLSEEFIEMVQNRYNIGKTKKEEKEKKKEEEERPEKELAPGLVDIIRERIGSCEQDLEDEDDEDCEECEDDEDTDEELEEVIDELREKEKSSDSGDDESSDSSDDSGDDESSDSGDDSSPVFHQKCRKCDSVIKGTSLYKTKVRNEDKFDTAHFCSIRCFEHEKHWPKKK